MTLRRFIAVSLLVILSACGMEDTTTNCSTHEKFPYCPQFITVEAIDVAHVLPAPPAKGSKEFKAELRDIIKRQAKLTDAQKATIAQEDHISPEMIVVPVLGAQYTEENYPQLYLLMRHAASDAWRVSDATEDHFMSPRPWYIDKRVKLYVGKITRPGYPSGHTTTNTVWANILADLFPAKREALFARAMEIGNDRVAAGAHFPHDVRAGRQLGDFIAGKMKLNDTYQREFAAAQAEMTTH